MNRENSLDAIVKMEWSMMKKVNNIAGTAVCQTDEDKFTMMRKSQFEVWSSKTIESYMNDLITAIDEKRNLVEEKYAYMMEYTDPEYYYKFIESKLSVISDEKFKLIRMLTDMVIKDEIILSREYPMLAKGGRPIFLKDDTRGWASIETYHIGELKTYSIETLKCLQADYVKIKEMGKNIAKENLMNIVRKSGYISLEEAEKSVKIM